MRSFLAMLKLLAFVFISVFIVPVQLLVLLFTKGAGAYILPRIWHAVICRVFGLGVITEGTPERNRQVIYMSNHLSYLDILALGGILRKSSFVAKKDVASWPVFGFLANLQQTAYIERRPSAIQRERDKIKKRVDRKQNLIIFPEGTSTDGLAVRNFKSSLFSLADGRDHPNLMVQPVSIAVKTVDGKAPDTLAALRHYTWPVEDETPLGAHLWRFARTSGATLQLVFHPPLKAGDFEDRKTLAKVCQKQVSQGLENYKPRVKIIEEHTTHG